MASGIGSGGNIGLLTALVRGGGNASAVLGGRGAASLINASINNINSINEARDYARNRSEGRTNFNASRALFGNVNNSLFRALSASNAARFGQASQSSTTVENREALTQRLSKVPLDRLFILKSAVSDNPDSQVPRALQRSIDNLTDRDRTTFKLAVDDAIKIAEARESKNSSGDSGSIFNISA